MTDGPDERSHAFTDDLDGWITHTDLASRDPQATRAWCADVLGWQFQSPFLTPEVVGGALAAAARPARRADRGAEPEPRRLGHVPALHRARAGRGLHVAPHALGRWVTAIGGNVEAARRAGINVRRVYQSVFVLCSTLAAPAACSRPVAWPP